MSLLSKAKEELKAEKAAEKALLRKKEQAAKKAKQDAQAQKKNWFDRIKTLVSEEDITLEQEKDPSEYSKVLGVLKKKGATIGYFVQITERYCMRYSDDTPEVEDQEDYICLTLDSDYDPRANYVSRDGHPFFKVKMGWEKDKVIEEIGRQMVNFYKRKKLA
jgi:hypothetical protein